MNINSLRTRWITRATTLGGCLLLALYTNLSMAAAPKGIKPGIWTGGDPKDNKPYYACLNVSEDGQRLTPDGTRCRGEQGQNRHSIEIKYQNGKTPEGDRCNQNSYRGPDFGDIKIDKKGRINTVFTNSWVSTRIKGKFIPEKNLFKGETRTITSNIDCTIKWQAKPGAQDTEPVDPPNSIEPPTTGGDPVGIAAGLWKGGNESTEKPFFACLNVSPDGKRLTAINTQCRGNRGQNQNSIDIQFQGGTTPEGAVCNEYSYRNLQYGDININTDGSFSTNFNNGWIDTTITGQFNGGSVTGTVRSKNLFGKDCSVNWDAIPAS